MSRRLSDWLTHLHDLHVRSIDLELGRIQRVAQTLQIKQPICPVVTVAGTNGKGSVVGFLEALYVNAGYNVAAFTSPYLISFNEQFRFNQQWIEDEKLCRYFEKINHARGDITLTYFEF
ncbi:MAG: bifunctional folylpolyglutamate synthase/dihydrofolate synthase, partial [Pseudomonadota bacterium]